MPHRHLDKWFYELWQQYQDADKAYKSYQNEVHHKHGAPFGGASSESQAQWTDEEKEQLDKLEWARKKASERVLGHHGSFEYVRCWMVDVVSHKAESMQSEELIEQMHEGRRHEYIKHFGALASEVRKVMSKFNLTDSGGGCGSWHLGCHSTEAEAYLLCRTLCTRFSGAITKGFLCIERKPWSIVLVEELWYE